MKGTGCGFIAVEYDTSYKYLQARKNTFSYRFYFIHFVKGNKGKMTFDENDEKETDDYWENRVGGKGTNKVHDKMNFYATAK